MVNGRDPLDNFDQSDLSDDLDMGEDTEAGEGRDYSPRDFEQDFKSPQRKVADHNKSIGQKGTGAGNIDRRLGRAKVPGTTGGTIERGASQAAGKMAGQAVGKVGGAAAGRATGAAAGTAIGGPLGTAAGYIAGTLLSSKLGQRATKWVIVGAFILFVFFFSIIFLIVFAIVAPYLKGFGGSTPTQAIEASFENDMDMIRIAFCLDELANVDKGIDKQGKEKEIEGVILSDRCRQVNEKAAKKALQSLANIKKGLEVYEDSSQKQELVRTIGDMEGKLNAIIVANGVYKTTRKAVDEYEVLRKAYNELIKKLVINCEDIQVALGAPNDIGLFVLPSHFDDARSPIHYYFDAQGPKSTKYVSDKMACYLFRLTKKWQALSGDTIEIGDASLTSGIQAYDGHGQHGGGGNADIWVPNVMWAKLGSGGYNDAKAIELAKLIRDLGAQELFVTLNPSGTGLNVNYRNFPLVNVTSGHADHWHICIHNC